ncbi:MAG: hypothetical protein QXS54_00865 [Candidatus Methanomethylicaceae archaeon]
MLFHSKPYSIPSAFRAKYKEYAAFLIVSCLGLLLLLAPSVITTLTHFTAQLRPHFINVQAAGGERKPVDDEVVFVITFFHPTHAALLIYVNDEVHDVISVPPSCQRWQCGPQRVVYTWRGIQEGVYRFRFALVPSAHTIQPQLKSSSIPIFLTREPGSSIPRTFHAFPVNR